MSNDKEDYLQAVSLATMIPVKTIKETMVSIEKHINPPKPLAESFNAAIRNITNIDHKKLKKMLEVERQHSIPDFKDQFNKQVIKHTLENGYCVVRYPHSEDRIYINTKDGLVSDTVSNIAINKDGKLLYKP